MAKWPKFAASNRAGTCLWCGATLQPVKRYTDDERRAQYGEAYRRPKLLAQIGTIVGYGYGAGGAFCSLRCGFMFAERMADLGKRLEPVHPE